MKIEIGRVSLRPEGICFYGKKGLRIIFLFPIQIGVFVIQEVSEEDLRWEIVREGKKFFAIGYDSKLGMVVKVKLDRVHVLPVIRESICRKFKVNVVDKEELREFLCRGRKS